MEKSFIKRCLTEYQNNCNQQTYDKVNVFYETFIKSVEPLEEWYNQYLRKIDLIITPPQEETKHISLFDFKSGNYKISNIDSLDIQEFIKNNPVNNDVV